MSKNKSRITLKGLYSLILTFIFLSYQAQQRSNKLLETIILKAFEAYTPSDSVAYFDLGDRIDTVAKPTYVKGKKIIYTDPKWNKKIFENVDKIKLFQVVELRMNGSEILVPVILFNATFQSNTVFANSPEFYLNLFFRYNCTLNQFELFNKKLRVLQK